MRELRRVLYVEDERDIHEIARLALELIGRLVVKTCGSGPEALAEVEAFSPDLILLDVMMPGMDGPATLQALRQIPAVTRLPVAFMTAKTDPSEIAHLKQLGAIAVIAKPFDPMRLAAQLRDVFQTHVAASATLAPGR
ncbi:response regulator [Aquimonas voraii]|uniref:Response regulator receiver domain-containing protein n=1 Tax=Aquimonas voraii TaxID=265719 RepID=A0A1G6U008_9GAMM|nr:response regulator [Aquimonas voraii]SDD34524.1 Response regulator receiver domain-containing protein [Aquimonas voraii]